MVARVSAYSGHLLNHAGFVVFVWAYSIIISYSYLAQGFFSMVVAAGWKDSSE